MWRVPVHSQTKPQNRVLLNINKLIRRAHYTIAVAGSYSEAARHMTTAKLAGRSALLACYWVVLPVITAPSSNFTPMSTDIFNCEISFKLKVILFPSMVK